MVAFVFVLSLLEAEISADIHQFRVTMNFLEVIKAFSTVFIIVFMQWYQFYVPGSRHIIIFVATIVIS